MPYIIWRMAKGAILIIAEKPDAAKHISKALAEKGLKTLESKHGVKYYTFFRGARKHIVVAAVGHLFNLKTTDKGYPVFNIEWHPSFEIRRASAFSEKYYRTIDDVVKENVISEVVSAADYDNEGSVIAYNVIQFMTGKKDGKRMKFSTLAKVDLIESYKKMAPHLDWQNIEAGVARHRLDFMYGISTSRALMHAIKTHGKRFAILSAGRVQGPVLTMLAEKEAEIAKFDPVPYSEIQLELDIMGMKVIAIHEKGKIWDKKEAEKILKECKGKKPVVDSVKKKEYLQNPPKPFNITSLQTEAYRLFGYSPQQSMGYAQKLYTSAYSSYPRTSSEKLPPQINYKAILEAVASLKKYKNLAKKVLQGPLTPREGKRTDPAHEAIHPTVEPPKRALTGPLGKIYDWITRRFFSVFGTSAKRESVKLTLMVGKHKFTVTGRRTIEKGWTEFYGPYAKADEIVFPEFKKGDKLKSKKLEKLDKETQPPPRYSQAAMIKEMEKRGLGTRATRSSIMQTLYNRDYIYDKSIHVTDLGMTIARTLKKYVPVLVDANLTKSFDDAMLDIITKGKKKEPILNKAKKALDKISDEISAHEKDIGSTLSAAIIKTQEERSNMGVCPDCKGQLKLLFNPFTKKSFVGCQSYNKCKKCGFSKKACKCKCLICKGVKGKCECKWKEKVWNPSCQRGYPVPHGARITNLHKICPECTSTIVRVQRFGKRPFNMCLTIDCKTKENWGKDKKGKKKGKAGVKGKKKVTVKGKSKISAKKKRVTKLLKKRVVKFKIKKKVSKKKV
jgi:DNA topoisomerase I